MDLATIPYRQAVRVVQDDNRDTSLPTVGAAVATGTVTRRRTGASRAGHADEIPASQPVLVTAVSQGKRGRPLRAHSRFPAQQAAPAIDVIHSTRRLARDKSAPAPRAPPSQLIQPRAPEPQPIQADAPRPPASYPPPAQNLACVDHRDVYGCPDQPNLGGYHARSGRWYVASPPPIQSSAPQNGTDSIYIIVASVLVPLILLALTASLVARYLRAEHVAAVRRWLRWNDHSSAGGSAHPTPEDAKNPPIADLVDKLPCVTVTAQHLRSVEQAALKAVANTLVPGTVRAVGGNVKLPRGDSGVIVQLGADATILGRCDSRRSGSASHIVVLVREDDANGAGVEQTSAGQQGQHSHGRGGGCSSSRGGFGACEVCDGGCGDTHEGDVTSATAEGSPIHMGDEYRDTRWLEEQCTICLMEWETGDEVVALPCRHYFHHSCALRWAEAQKSDVKLCPTCKQPMFLAQTSQQ